MLFEQLCRHSLWHVTSRDISKGVIVVNGFSHVTSAKFEIFFRSKKHSIPLRNVILGGIITLTAVVSSALIQSLFTRKAGSCLMGGYEG